MSAKFHRNLLLLRYFCKLVTLLPRTVMSVAHYSSHVSDRNTSNSLNFYANRVKQEHYLYISTMIYTLVTLAESNSSSVVRNGGVDDQYGTLGRTPSIPMLYPFLRYFTPCYDRSTCNVPYEPSKMT